MDFFLNMSSPQFSIGTVIKMISFCLSSNYFKFDNKCYTQISGALMGSSVSNSAEILVVQFIEKKLNSIFNDKITFYHRYVDGIFFK